MMRKVIVHTGRRTSLITVRVEVAVVGAIGEAGAISEGDVEMVEVGVVVVVDLEEAVAADLAAVAVAVDLVGVAVVEDLEGVVDLEMVVAVGEGLETRSVGMMEVVGVDLENRLTAIAATIEEVVSEEVAEV